MITGPATPGAAKRSTPTAGSTATSTAIAVAWSGSAISGCEQGVKPARPLTHDLLRDVLAALQAPLRAVEIT
ncbi:bifunctional nuclease domain-containing protein, partial [Micromonospora tulbaghiae]